MFKDIKIDEEKFEYFSRILLLFHFSEDNLDENNDNRVFVSCDDILTEASKIKRSMDFIRHMKRKVQIHGDYDERFSEKQIKFYYLYNGADIMVEDFLRSLYRRFMDNCFPCTW